MTASLPSEIQSIFERYRIAEYTVVDLDGQPITWPVRPRYTPGAPYIDVETPADHPKKAAVARDNTLVGLLFSEPKGSGVDGSPMVLVQGTADVHPGEPDPQRICVHVRPERVYMWPAGGIDDEPAIYGAHMEEVRSGHSEEPDRFHSVPVGGATAHDQRLTQIGARHTRGVLSLVSPDGFPFSARVPVEYDAHSGLVRLLAEAAGVPLQPGLACLTLHERGEELDWEHSFHVRGDLVEVGNGWALLPHRVFSGDELEALDA